MNCCKGEVGGRDEKAKEGTAQGRWPSDFPALTARREPRWAGGERPHPECLVSFTANVQLAGQCRCGRRLHPVRKNPYERSRAGSGGEDESGRSPLEKRVRDATEAGVQGSAELSLVRRCCR